MFDCPPIRLGFSNVCSVSQSHLQTAQITTVSLCKPFQHDSYALLPAVGRHRGGIERTRMPPIGASLRQRGCHRSAPGGIEGHWGIGCPSRRRALRASDCPPAHRGASIGGGCPRRRAASLRGVRVPASRYRPDRHPRGVRFGRKLALDTSHPGGIEDQKKAPRFPGGLFFLPTTSRR